MADHARPRPREDLEYEMPSSRRWYTWMLCLAGFDGEFQTGRHIADIRDGVYGTSPLSILRGYRIRILYDNLCLISKIVWMVGNRKPNALPTS